MILQLWSHGHVLCIMQANECKQTHLYQDFRNVDDIQFQKQNSG